MVPVTLLAAALFMSCFSYYEAKCDISDDLNVAMITLAREKAGMLTRQDTACAVRRLSAATGTPVMCKASTLSTQYEALKDNTFYSLEIVDGEFSSTVVAHTAFVSDSIILMPAPHTDGVTMRMRGYADCSASVIFAASDQSVPGFLFILSMVSVCSILALRKKNAAEPMKDRISIDGLRLTPMQRRLMQMLIEAPDMRVGKYDICAALWGEKDNAEESLYTLVRRTKAAISEAGLEIICNRGESYALDIKR